MMFDQFNHLTVLRYLLCIHFLSDWCFSQVAVTGADIKTVCIHNATASSLIGIHCGTSNRRSRKIEVLSTYFDHRQTSRHARGCVGSAANNQCRTLLTTGEQFLKTTARNRCSFLQRCNFPLGELPTTDCTNSTPFNFVLLKYKCIPYTDFVELCGNADVNITSDVKHLAYINDDSFQNCTCSIQGAHTLTAVNVQGIPSTAQRNCSSNKQNIWINWTPVDGSASTTTVLKPDQQLINVDYEDLQSSHIKLIRNCRPTSPPDWFKITPVKGKTVRIQCGESINNSPSRIPPKISSSSTTSTTDATNNDAEKEKVVAMHNTKFTVTSTTSSTGTTEVSRSTEIMHTTDTIKSILAETSIKEDEQNPVTGKHTNVSMIVGLVIGGIVFILIIAIGVIVYRRKQKSSRQKYKLQMKRTNTLTSMKKEISRI